MYDADPESVMEQIDVAVVGAGVTGLAAARAIARTGRSVCVLERHPRPGLDTSTHNSGVIHAGIYHPAGSLKSTLCVRGSHLLYEFCAAHNVPHRRCGKLVVAADDRERAALEPLLARASPTASRDSCWSTPMSPSAGSLTRAPSPRSSRPEAASSTQKPTSARCCAPARIQASCSCREPGCVGAEPHASGIVLRTAREAMLAGQVVNAAGLYADDVSAMLGGEPFTIYPCRGEYAEFTPARRHLVNALVYPLPHASGHGLGVHLVRTTGGEVWLGPTIHYQARKDDYEGNRLPLDAFVEPARRLLRDVQLQDLRLSGSGIRAKLHPPSESFADFMIRRDTVNPSVVQAAGIDSPGLTSSLAIGELVGKIVAER